MAEDVGGAEPQAGLSRERVLREAMRLADQHGMDALSMRKLGSVLGAGAMSLYHYVANKEELLDGMVDLVFAEIELPTSEGDWREVMRRQLASARDVLVRHGQPFNVTAFPHSNPSIAGLHFTHLQQI